MVALPREPATSQPSLQLFAQGEAAAVHPSLHGRLLDAEDLADLAQRKAADLLEHERQAIIRGQTAESAIDDLHGLAAHLLLERPLVRRAQLEHPGRPRRQLGVERLQARRLTRSSAAHPLASPRGDGVEPARRARPTLELVPAAKGLQERLLHEVLGIRPVAAELQTERQQLGAVILDELGHHLGRRAPQHALCGAVAGDFHPLQSTAIRPVRRVRGNLRGIPCLSEERGRPQTGLPDFGGGEPACSNGSHNRGPGTWPARSSG